MNNSVTVLADRMLTRAVVDELSIDHPVRVTALAFDAAAVGFYAAEQTHTVQQFLGAWTRARKAWRDYTGEEL